MNATAVITAWTAVSPYGVGGPALTAGLRSAVAPEPVAAPDGWLAEEGDSARLVPGFDLREQLGRAGTRGMDRITGLTAVAVRDLLGPGGAEDALGTGLVLGTAAGSVQGFLDFTRASLLGARPIDVPLSTLPNMAMNRAASASAIRHGLKGPNSTVSAGRLSGLAALGHAAELLAAGRARRVLAGSVEEYSAARARLAAAEDARTVLGEGCALVLLESADRPQGRPLAQVLAVRQRFALDGDFADQLTACVRTALAAAGAGPDAVWAVLAGRAAGAAGEGEQAALDRLFGPEPQHRLPATTPLGDTAGATTGFQLAAALGAEPDPQPRLVLLTGTDPGGPVGCALLRLLPCPADQDPVEDAETDDAQEGAR